MILDSDETDPIEREGRRVIEAIRNNSAARLAVMTALAGSLPPRARRRLAARLDTLTAESAALLQRIEALAAARDRTGTA